MAFRWYVVHTYSGFENKVKVSLLERIEAAGMQAFFSDILVPEEDIVELVSGEKKTSKRKFFPGYILVEMNLTDKTHHYIRHRPNVTGFVGNDRGPRPLSPKEVEGIRQQMDEGPVRAVAEVQFEEGSAVRIKDGPFVNFSGIIEEVRAEKRKLRVLVTIFGRATPVELDFNQVERV